MPYSVSHGLYQHPLLPFYRSLSSFTDRSVDGQCIITIYSDSVEAVCWSTGGNSVTGILVNNGG